MREKKGGLSKIKTYDKIMREYRLKATERARKTRGMLTERSILVHWGCRVTTVSFSMMPFTYWKIRQSKALFYSQNTFIAHSEDDFNHALNLVGPSHILEKMRCIIKQHPALQQPSFKMSHKCSIVGLLTELAAKDSNHTHHFQNIYILLITVVKDSSCEFSPAVLRDFSKNLGPLQYYEHGVRTGRSITFLLITKVNKYAKTRHDDTFMFLSRSSRGLQLCNYTSLHLAQFCLFYRSKSHN